MSDNQKLMQQLDEAFAASMKDGSDPLDKLVAIIRGLSDEDLKQVRERLANELEPEDG
jgi:hypothetical protein